MPLKNRITKLEVKCLISTEPDAFALSWWNLCYQMDRDDNPALPEEACPPPADWITHYNGKTIDDVLREYEAEYGC